MINNDTAMAAKNEEKIEIKIESNKIIEIN